MSMDFAAVKHALAEARARSGDARRDWLIELEQRDPELHAEVMSLLAHEHAEAPAVGLLAAQIVGHEGAATSATGTSGTGLNRTVTDRRGRTYELLAALGTGGFGKVYLARMRADGLDRLVALKLLKRGFEPNSQAVGRMRDEARLLASLRHPVILTIHALAEFEHRIGLITEYIEGDDLSGCLQGEDALPVPTLLEVVEQVAGALDVAWREHKVVHRDIKPQNIRIGVHGSVKLLDFGIARSDELPRDAQTESHALIGTLRYIAPERFEADSPVTPALDVFALGCLIFEGVVGEQFYANATFAQICALSISRRRYQEHADEQLARIENADLRALLTSMLAFEPDARLSGAEVAQRCEEVASSWPRRISLRRWCQRRAWPESPVPRAGQAKPGSASGSPAASTYSPDRTASTMEVLGVAFHRLRMSKNTLVAVVMLAALAIGAWAWFTRTPEPDDLHWPPEPASELTDQQRIEMLRRKKPPPEPEPPADTPSTPPPVEVLEKPEPKEAPPPKVATTKVGFFSQPLGADVIIDGRTEGSTPHYAWLELRKHRVKLMLDGKSHRATITVGRNQPTVYSWNVETGDWSGSVER